MSSTISESQFSSPAERTTPFSTIHQPHHQPQRRRRQFDGESCRYWWLDRVARSCKAVHRKTQDAVYQGLHKFAENGELRGFALIYLGQQDASFPGGPAILSVAKRCETIPRTSRQCQPRIWSCWRNAAST